MRCVKCKKIIPSTSRVCPYCFTPVVKDENIETLDDGSANNQTTVDFGSIDNISYDSSNKLKTGLFKEKNNDKKNIKKRVLILVSGIALVLIVLVIVARVISGPRVPNYKYYTDVIDNTYQFLSDEFTSSSAAQGGTYKLVYKYNKTNEEFRGSYGLNLSKKLFYLNGTLRNPGEDSGEVIINPTASFSFDLMGKYNNFYFKSSELYNNMILLPYEDETGLLTTKNYDLDTLVSGITDALDDAFKSSSFTRENNVEINYHNNKKSLTKISLKLDNKGKYTFFDTFYSSLADNTNFITEYARISGLDDTSAVKTFTNLETTANYKYSVESDDYTYINLYHDKNHVYRIEFDINEDNFKGKILLDKSENDKYYLSVIQDSVEKLSATLSTNSTMMNEKETKDFMFTYNTNDTDLQGTLEIERLNDPNIKINDPKETDYKSIRSFNEDDINQLKNNLSIYIKDVSWIDNLQTIFGTKCSTSLKCNCKSNENCSCEYQGRIISCPSDIVNPKE